MTPKANLVGRLLVAGSLLVAAACDAAPRLTGGPSTNAPARATGAASPVASRPTASVTTRVEGRGTDAVLVGEPIELASLTGKVVFDDFEDVFTMNAEAARSPLTRGRSSTARGRPTGNRSSIAIRRGGSTRTTRSTSRAPTEPSGGTSPTIPPTTGERTGRRTVAIAFNSDRDGGRCGGISSSGRLEPPPDRGRRLVRIPVVLARRPVDRVHRPRRVRLRGLHVELATGTPGGSRTARATTRGRSGRPTARRSPSRRSATTALGSGRRRLLASGEPGEHHDVWIMDVDGGNQRRVSPEIGQFMAWSPDSRYLLISGHTLFVVRRTAPGGSRCGRPR